MCSIPLLLNFGDLDELGVSGRGDRMIRGSDIVGEGLDPLKEEVHVNLVTGED